MAPFAPTHGVLSRRDRLLSPPLGSRDGAAPPGPPDARRDDERNGTTGTTGICTGTGLQFERISLRPIVYLLFTTLFLSACAIILEKWT